MSKNKTKTVEKVPEKKLNRLLIEEKLEVGLSDLKSLLSKKKFESGVKRAAKMLTKDFSKKSLENFRKQKEPITLETEMTEETNQLIAELP